MNAIQSGREYGQWMMEEVFADCEGSESWGLFSYLGSTDGWWFSFVVETEWGKWETVCAQLNKQLFYYNKPSYLLCALPPTPQEATILNSF